MTDVDVLIVGAGTVGMALCQGLKKAGIRATICEQDSEDTFHNRPRDWGLTLHWGFELIDKLLPPEVRARISEILCDPYYKPTDQDADLITYAGHTGEVSIRTPAADAQSVSRKKMRKFLSQGLDIQYGKRLVNIEGSSNLATAVFEDGERKSAKLFIGCDGAHSRIRSMLVGADAAKVKDIGLNLVNFGAKFDRETALLIQKQHPIFYNTVHPDGYMFFLRILDNPAPIAPESWTFQHIFAWKGVPYAGDFASQAERTAWLKGRAALFADPWRSVLSRIPDDVMFTVDAINTWSPVDWSASPLCGRVTLAGDAAHALAPMRGQGLNNGLEDAVQLVDQIRQADDTDDSLLQAVRAYEEEMIDRGRRDVEISETSATMLLDYERVLRSPLAKLGLKKSVGSEDSPVDSVMGTPA